MLNDERNSVDPETAATRVPLGVVASEKCAQRSDDKKRWWSLRKFVKAYYPLLRGYHIFTLRKTEELINDAIAELKRGRFPDAWLDVESLGREEFSGVVRLAAMVARGQVKRVLVFQDPDDLGIERAGLYALIRNCNIHGRKLCMNAAAHLWAVHTMAAPGDPYITTPKTLPVPESVAFIAHNNEKLRMARFVLHYRHELSRFPRLIATSGTRAFIENYLKDNAPPWDRLKIETAGGTDATGHGPKGGDVIIADGIFNTYNMPVVRDEGFHVYDHVIFFIDHKNTHPHEPDIQVLLKTCANPEHRVNLILNSRMAEEWAERYRNARDELAG